jgi:hypothetical protein
MIESLEASLPNDGSEAGECIRQEIIILKNKKSLIMRNPSILVQGNKRSVEGEDQQSHKKARPDTTQAPVTTFNNPKASLASATTNSFSINQLLTPPSSFTPLASPSIVGSGDDKDFRTFSHPHLLSSLPFPPEPTRVDSKHIIDARAPYPSPLSFLPDDEPRHVDGTPLLHPPSSDSYYYQRLAYQYHPYARQMLPPSYPPPSHVLSPHIARNPYYTHPFGVPPPHDSHRQQQNQVASESHNEHQLQQHSEQEQGERTQHQAQSQTTQQQSTTHQQSQHTQHSLHGSQKQQMQQSPRQTTTQQPNNSEALPKISSDMYKFNRPPSPNPSPSFPPSSSQGDMYYFSQFPQQQQRLHQ